MYSEQVRAAACGPACRSWEPSEYLFEGTSLAVHIDQADLDGIHGRFTLEAQLGLGERLENGQREEVHLPNGGAIQVESRFNITDIRVR